MKTYEISYARGVKKDFRSIDRGATIRIITAIQSLAINPRGVKKLTGRDYHRIRIGDYRVIYSIEDSRLVVLVVEVGHRKKVYR